MIVESNSDESSCQSEEQNSIQKLTLQENILNEKLIKNEKADIKANMVDERFGFGN